MFFINKQKQIESLLDDYRQQVSKCLEVCELAFTQYLDEPDRSRLEKNFLDISRAESGADTIRREVEVMMYSKALFPESRGDILGLLETMDKVPNQAETVTQALLNQHVLIPQQYREQIKQLITICRRCVEAMLDGAGKLFTDFTNATVAVGKVDELESEADHIEEAIIEQVFSSNIEGFEKILLRDLVNQIAGISDRAENTADRIRIIAAKRKV
jgi:predicted phosphate transport protein (TIGR00153 family)